VKGSTTVGACLCVIWVLSTTFAAVNQNNPSLLFSFAFVLRFAVAGNSVRQLLDIMFKLIRNHDRSVLEHIEGANPPYELFKIQRSRWDSNSKPSGDITRKPNILLAL
jgi:hypothetical protein